MLEFKLRSNMQQRSFSLATTFSSFMVAFSFICVLNELYIILELNDKVGFRLFSSRQPTQNVSQQVSCDRRMAQAEGNRTWNPPDFWVICSYPVRMCVMNVLFSHGQADGWQTMRGWCQPVPSGDGDSLQAKAATAGCQQQQPLLARLWNGVSVGVHTPLWATVGRFDCFGCAVPHLWINGRFCHPHQ